MIRIPSPSVWRDGAPCKWLKYELCILSHLNYLKTMIEKPLSLHAVHYAEILQNLIWQPLGCKESDMTEWLNWIGTVWAWEWEESHAGGLQSKGWQRVGLDWVTYTQHVNKENLWPNESESCSVMSDSLQPNGCQMRFCRISA